MVLLSFKIVKFVIYLCDVITDTIFGYSFTNGYREERLRAWQSYECSAHVVKIFGRQDK